MTPTMESPNVRIYCVRKDDCPEIIRIRADTVCEEKQRSTTYLTFKRDGEIVGKILGVGIDWWIEEVPSA